MFTFDEDGCVTVSCEKCFADLRAGYFSSKKDCIAELEGMGWLIRIDGGQLKECLCPTCAQGLLPVYVGRGRGAVGS